MTVLTMKAMGINDLLNFDFMDPPPPQVRADSAGCGAIIWPSMHMLGEDLLTALIRRRHGLLHHPPLSCGHSTAECSQPTQCGRP